LYNYCSVISTQTVLNGDILGTDGGTGNVRVYSDANESTFLRGGYTTQIVYTPDMLNQNYLDQAIVKLLGNAQVTSFNCSSAIDGAYVAGNVSIRKVGINPDGSVYVYIYNSGANKYLRTIEIAAAYVVTTPQVIATPNGTQIVSDTIYNPDSIAQFGKLEYVLNSRWAFGGRSNEYAFDFTASNLLYRFIRVFSQTSNLFQLDMQYDPNVRLGRVVQVKNKQGRLATGVVINCSIQSEGVDQVQTITVKELLFTATSAFDDTGYAWDDPAYSLS